MQTRMTIMMMQFTDFLMVCEQEETCVKSKGIDGRCTLRILLFENERKKNQRRQFSGRICNFRQKLTSNKDQDFIIYFSPLIISLCSFIFFYAALLYTARNAQRDSRHFMLLITAHKVKQERGIISKKKRLEVKSLYNFVTYDLIKHLTKMQSAYKFICLDKFTISILISLEEQSNTDDSPKRIIL